MSRGFTYTQAQILFSTYAISQQKRQWKDKPQGNKMMY